MDLDQHEFEVVEIIRHRCREYRDLLTVAASLVKQLKVEDDRFDEAVNLFLEKCEEHGIVREKNDQRD